MRYIAIHIILVMIFSFGCSKDVFGQGGSDKKATKPLRILFVVGYFPVLSETFILNQITELIDHGHDVWIHSFHRGDTKVVQRSVRKYKLLDRVTFGSLSSYIDKFDIIYCQFGFHGKRVALYMRQKELLGKKTKLITCFRGTDLTTFIRSNGKKTYATLFALGDLFLPVCKNYKKRLVKYGCCASKVKVHHSAIECDKFPYKKCTLKEGDPIRFISVGRLVEKKGIRYAIEAIALIVKKYPNITYTIIGDGPERPFLEYLISRYRLHNHVHLAGALPHNKVIELLQQSHIFILPCCTAYDGNEEGIPNVLKEAMSIGLPVISTYHAGISELVEHNVSGILVQERDVNELINALEYLITHKKIWPAMGKAGHEKVVNEFDLKKLVKKLEAMFRYLARKR